MVGAGNIAQAAVLAAFAHAKANSELVALISGHKEKLKELADRFDLALIGDYGLERVLKQGEVDAVDITTPNASHQGIALRAAASGVHVPCEKPLAPTVRECEVISDACSKGRVKLMIAYRLHFEEGTLSAIELVKAGKIGDPRVFESVFGHVRTRADLGGGAVKRLGGVLRQCSSKLVPDESRCSTSPRGSPEARERRALPVTVACGEMWLLRLKRDRQSASLN